MRKTRDLFKKIRYTKGTFHARMGSIKDRKGKGERERHTQLNAKFQRIARRDKAFLNEQ